VPTLVTAASQVLGCTPCECGIPGACSQEKLPVFLHFIPPSVVFIAISFLTPMIFVLTASLLTRWALKQIFKNLNRTAINTVAVCIGSLFVLRFMLNYFLLNLSSAKVSLIPLIASVVSVILIYIAFSFLDLRKEKTPFIHLVLGILIIFSFISLFTFTVRRDKISRYEKVVETNRLSFNSVLRSLGLLDRSAEVVGLLKTKNYTPLVNYINPSKKLKINFRDYGGVNFDKDEFLDVIQNNQLFKVNAYKRVDDFAITAGELLSEVNELLSSQHKTSYYIDDHNYVDESKVLSDYNEVDFIYELDDRTTVLSFTKDSTNDTWYLSKIEYFDLDYPGY
jgi:multisubunit Na+/H+ antiporter MnhB subunit